MSILMNDLTSRECKAYLDRGGDLVFAPLGTVERLGPHLPLGARNMVVSAIAQLMAQKNDGLSLPLIPYSTVYDAFKQRGSMDIPPDFIHKYCCDLCDELVANGFKRIVFVSFQEELYYLCHDYFQVHHVAVVYIHPDSFFGKGDTVAASLDVHGRELWRLAACLGAAGNQEMLERIFAKTQAFFHTFTPVVNNGKRALDMLGNTGHKMAQDEWQFYPVNLGKSLEDASVPFAMPSQTLLDKAKDELMGWIDSLGPSVADISLYQNYLNNLTFKRPL